MITMQIIEIICDICNMKYQYKTKDEMKSCICELIFDNTRLNQIYSRHICKACASNITTWFIAYSKTSV